MLGPRRCPRCNSTRCEVAVVTYRANYSVFHGRRRTPSEYSEVQAKCCGSRWRTKAAYTDTVYYTVQGGQEVPWDKNLILGPDEDPDPAWT